mmetsp:Transcript_1586/g.3599  ORF Transcript_1586/g.3599 Transcript_1586/m.3599 type:complete len:556 (+) Transcript_1586:63-1730(+)
MAGSPTNGRVFRLIPYLIGIGIGIICTTLRSDVHVRQQGVQLLADSAPIVNNSAVVPAMQAAHREVQALRAEVSALKEEMRRHTAAEEKSKAKVTASVAGNSSGQNLATPSSSSRAAVANTPPREMLDIMSHSCKQCFRAADRPVHRSVLAIGVTAEVPALHSQQYEVMYINFDAAAQERLFRGGRPSVLLKQGSDVYGGLGQLPIADLAVDVVLVNATLLARFSDSPRAQGVLAEMLRVLVPGGTFALTPPLGLAHKVVLFVTNHALLRQHGRFANVFHRTRKLVEGLPVCKECGLRSPFGRQQADAQGDCQPYISDAYVAPTDPKRSAEILREGFLDRGRLKWWPCSNVLRTQTSSAWTDIVYAGQREWFFSNYVGHTQKDGSRQLISKAEWRNEFSEWIKSGRVRSVLDAGAGSCTLAAQLRAQGLFNSLKPFISFGAYDCSQLRICAERGGVSLQWNWVQPLPFCNTCVFDLIFQAQGVHHVAPSNWDTSWDNFDAHLACNGFLFLNDHPCTLSEKHSVGKTMMCWRESVHAWARRKGYSVWGDIIVHKKC